MIFYKRYKYYTSILGIIFLLTGCSVVKTTGNVIGVVGKTVYTTAKITGKVVGTTCVVAGKGVKTVVNMATGKHVVKLKKLGNSFAVAALLNRKINAELIVDTGATNTVISNALARKLGIRASNSQDIMCHLADGRAVAGKQVNIREIIVGGARVSNVDAVVLDTGDMGYDQGLLGMSFLNNFIFKIDTEKGILILEKR
jgi:clan AA aspartic protease (TIGR02281 family)